ncbi:hypothetical protein ACFPA1_13495 [Neobacillus sp. GCM10023253]|uniref:hypothetical protein n=1 Tax=Neobacillus sp. GCM10023253 TaxID=3252644 RepID=UPI00361D8094
MTQHITTGPYPGQTGGCIAEYNHSTLSHVPHHYSPSHNPNHNPNHNPYYQQPMTGPGFQGIPSWRPPGGSYPYLY